ncbi:hypothetical protein D3C72_2033490 [compost metagenome]
MLGESHQGGEQLARDGRADVCRPWVAHAVHRQCRTALFPGDEIARFHLCYLPHVFGECRQGGVADRMALAKALQAGHGEALPGDHGEGVY